MERADIVQARAEWRRVQDETPCEHLVFLDENSAKTNMTRLYGRAPVGERCFDHAPDDRWKTVTMLEIVFLVLTWVVSTGVFASKDYWQIDAGGKTILTVRTESEVREAMSLLKNTYVEEKTRDVRISLNPVISVKHRYYGYMDRKPEVADVEDTRNIAIDSVRRNLISVKTSQTVDKKKRIKFSVVKKKDRTIHRNTSLVKKAGDEGTEIEIGRAHV